MLQNGTCRVYFQGGRHYNAKGATTTATEGSEEVYVLASTSSDNFTRREHNLEFENLICCQSEVMASGAVTTSLKVASDSTDSLKVAISNVSVFNGVGDLPWKNHQQQCGHVWPRRCILRPRYIRLPRQLRFRSSSTGMNRWTAHTSLETGAPA